MHCNQAHSSRHTERLNQQQSTLVTFAFVNRPSNSSAVHVRVFDKIDQRKEKGVEKRNARVQRITLSIRDSARREARKSTVDNVILFRGIVTQIQINVM